MRPGTFHRFTLVSCVVLCAGFSNLAAASTLCVNPTGSHSCYSTIQAAVNAAAKNDVIEVAPGTYTEDVVIGKPLSLLGAGAGQTTIDATNLPNGILLDGLDNPGLRNITVAGFTVQNALYEGVLVLDTSDATIRDNHIINNDTIGPVFGSGPACKGQPAYETDESGDCGGGLHLLGATDTIVTGNLITGNADGILISDDSAASHGNLVSNNNVNNNPVECGVVLASHPPMGSMPPNYAPHYGVYDNTVSGNFVSKNGVTVGGAGVGLFSDGEGPGRTSNNVVIGNTLTDNGIPGVALHTHVGPNFGASADNMSGNKIIGNFISGNGPDTTDTATPGPTGININSGGGGSPVYGTVISGNTIVNEQVGIAVNTPAELDAHLNNLPSSGIGVDNVCALDGAACTGSIDATGNFWGCASGPGTKGCSAAIGPSLLSIPWLMKAIPK
jgi:parallel beta-helix repeat protein